MREGRTLPATGAEYEELRWAGGMQAALGKGVHTHLPQDVLEHAVQVIALVRPLVEGIARRDRELASQVRHALSSVALNLAEGLGTEAGNSRLRFEAARGSLYEARAGLQVAVAWGYLSVETAAGPLEAMRSLGGRVYGLARR
jgi:four helix bundle protein